MGRGSRPRPSEGGKRSPRAEPEAMKDWAGAGGRGGEFCASGKTYVRVWVCMRCMCERVCVCVCMYNRVMCVCVCVRDSVCIWEIHVYVSVSKNIRVQSDL